MSTCDYSSYHPLTLLTLFAEIERGRHFNLANPMVRKLMQRARNIATAHPPPAYLGTSESNGVIQELEDYMQLWFEISCLKNGLQSWRQELQKMVSHCEDLTRAKFYTSKRSPESNESTPVNTFLSVDVFDSGDAAETPMDEVEDLTISGRRIRQRLLEILGEYDEKIRECGMIIEGMVLAAQLVSHDRSNVINYGVTANNIHPRNGTISAKAIHEPTKKYPIPTLRSQGPPERMDSRCVLSPC